jgi:hypothetical protein
MNENDIERVLDCAMRDLFSRDLYLITNDASERSIAHRLGIYLESHLKLLGSDLHVDCEYNRVNFTLPKILQCIDDRTIPKGRGVYPDLIVHDRGNNDNNLLVIEIKKSTSGDAGGFDKKKINGYVDELRYTYGFCLNIQTGAGVTETKKRKYCISYRRTSITNNTIQRGPGHDDGRGE